MKSIIPATDRIQAKLRAMVEIVNGKLKIYPIADTDQEADAIIKMLSRGFKGK